MFLLPCWQTSSERASTGRPAPHRPTHPMTLPRAHACNQAHVPCKATRQSWEWPAPSPAPLISQPLPLHTPALRCNAGPHSAAGGRRLLGALPAALQPRGLQKGQHRHVHPGQDALRGPPQVPHRVRRRPRPVPQLASAVGPPQCWTRVAGKHAAGVDLLAFSYLHAVKFATPPVIAPGAARTSPCLLVTIACRCIAACWAPCPGRISSPGHAPLCRVMGKLARILA